MRAVGLRLMVFQDQNDWLEERIRLRGHCLHDLSFTSWLKHERRQILKPSILQPQPILQALNLLLSQATIPLLGNTPRVRPRLSFPWRKAGPRDGALRVEGIGFRA